MKHLALVRVVVQTGGRLAADFVALIMQKGEKKAKVEVEVEVMQKFVSYLDISCSIRFLFFPSC